MCVEQKYKIGNLIQLINQNKGTDKIVTYYNSTSRTVRYWFKKEGLKTNYEDLEVFLKDKDNNG
jgi:hypothetical protein